MQPRRSLDAPDLGGCAIPIQHVDQLGSIYGSTPAARRRVAASLLFLVILLAAGFAYAGPPAGQGAPGQGAQGQGSPVYGAHHGVPRGSGPPASDRPVFSNGRGGHATVGGPSSPAAGSRGPGLGGSPAANVSNRDFTAGRLRFDQDFNPEGRVPNAGALTAGNGGLAALVGPALGNAGTIEARLGRAAPGAGKSFTLDLFGDQLVSFAVDEALAQRLTGLDGKGLEALVDHGGTNDAPDGRVRLSVNAVKAVLDGVINLAGVESAQAVSSREGRIVLAGAGGGLIGEDGSAAPLIPPSAPPVVGEPGSASILESLFSTCAFFVACGAAGPSPIAVALSPADLTVVPPQGEFPVPGPPSSPPAAPPGPPAASPGVNGPGPSPIAVALSPANLTVVPPQGECPVPGPPSSPPGAPPGPPAVPPGVSGPGPSPPPGDGRGGAPGDGQGGALGDGRGGPPGLLLPLGVTLRSLTEIETESSAETEEAASDPLYAYESTDSSADQETEEDGGGDAQGAFDLGLCDFSDEGGAGATSASAADGIAESDDDQFGSGTGSDRMKALPSTPIPLVEIGAHLDRTTSLDYDPIENRLVTASDDGTLRAWDAGTGRPLQTMRVPLGDRREGELYALAVDPAGKTVAAGGWTGYQWDEAVSIYLFDLDSGDLVRRIPGLDGAVTALDYSPDGTRLAAAIDTGEVLLYSVPDYTLIDSNAQCRSGIESLDYGADGTLATGCGDGVVRLYDKELALTAERELRAADRPVRVRFSPNGRRLAVAFAASDRVTVVDPDSLRVLFESGIDGPAAGSVSNVAWSADGQILYAAGDIDGAAFVRWSEGGRGAQTPVSAAHRVRDLLALRDGALAYTTRDLAVGIIETDGSERFHHAPGRIDHRGRAPYFRVSDDAGVVTFALDDAGTRYAEFSVSDRRYREVAQPYPDLRAPITEHPVIRLAGWDGSGTPTLNGSPLDPGSNQVIHSAAISPDDAFLVLGGDFELRAYEADGRLRWSREIGSDAHAVNVSGDAHVVVAAHQDGAIRWYRAGDGQEIMGLFVHADKEEWVAWIPSARYMSSPNGDRYVGWQLNNGPEATPDFYTAWQFERMLYRPDVVQKNFGCRGYVAGAGAEGTESFTIDRLRDSAPPGVSLAVTGLGAAGTATIQIAATKHNRPIEDYAVYVNSIPVTQFEDRVLSETERDAFQRSHTVPLYAGENEIRVEVLTDHSIEVAQAFLELDPSAVTVDRKGDLYVLAVGVNALEHIPESNLDYAAQDADELATRLEGNAGDLFERVHRRVLSDFSGELPTRENIVKALPFLRQAGPDDTVILFLAAHGLSNQAGDYHLVPRDAQAHDVAELLRETPSGKERRLDSVIRWDVFFSALRAASGRRMLIVDTCQAQKIEGTYDALSLAKRSAASSFALLAASKGDELSQEYPAGEHGLFTFALLDALDGAADTDGDGYVELSEMIGHTQSFVEVNRVEKRLTQTPQLVAPSSLTNTPLAVAE